MSYGKYVALVLVVISLFAILYLIGRMTVFYRLRADIPSTMKVPGMDVDQSFDILATSRLKVDQAYGRALGQSVLWVACGTACALGVLFL